MLVVKLRYVKVTLRLSCLFKLSSSGISIVVLRLLVILSVGPSYHMPHLSHYSFTCPIIHQDHLVAFEALLI